MANDIFKYDQIYRLVELFNKVKVGKDINQSERDELITLHRSFKALSKPVRLELLILSQCKRGSRNQSMMSSGCSSVDTSSDPRFKDISCCGDNYIAPPTSPSSSAPSVVPNAPSVVPKVVPSEKLCNLIQTKGLFIITDGQGKVVANLDPDTLIYTTVNYENGKTTITEHAWSKDDIHYLKTIVGEYVKMDDSLTVTVESIINTIDTNVITETKETTETTDSDTKTGSTTLAGAVSGDKEPISSKQISIRTWLMILIGSLLLLIALYFGYRFIMKK
jgi:hypothetical protein